MNAPARLDRGKQQRAWYWYDWANSAYVTTTATVLFGPYLTTVAKRAACPGQDTELPCATDLTVLGVPVSPGSIALYTVTVATLLSAVLLPMVGAVIDRTGRKRTIMAGFAWVGAAAAASMVAVSGTNWQLGAVLQLIASICLGSSLVAYDAILIDIAEPDERDRVSSRGWALGYLGGGVLLVITETAVRVSLFSAGLWWAGFTLIPYLGLRDLPPTGPDVGQGIESRSGAPDGVRRGLVTESFGQLRHTLTHLRGYPQTLLFLVAYLFYNDGIQTVIYASSIFGQEQLGFSSDQLVITILVVQFIGILGALAFGWLATRIGAHRSILGSMGYLLPSGAFGLFLALAVLIGIVLGGSQALSRSLFSQLIPRGREAEYFSLYQAAERGTSWFGTLLFGLVFQLTDSYRSAIIALVVFFVLGGTLLVRVDVRRGISEAGNAVPQVV
jgi:UMF1 family MFS transporter